MLIYQDCKRLHSKFWKEVVVWRCGNLKWCRECRHMGGGTAEPELVQRFQNFRSERFE